MTSSESPTNDHLAGSHIWSTMEGGDRRPAVWRIVSRGYGKHLSGARQIYRLRSLLHGPASLRGQDATSRASSSGSLPKSDQLTVSGVLLWSRIQRDTVPIPPIGHQRGRPTC